jgi:hypothetical protein
MVGLSILARMGFSCDALVRLYRCWGPFQSYDKAPEHGWAFEGQHRGVNLVRDGTSRVGLIALLVSKKG